MKRTPKPFSVEIKKSRAPRQPIPPKSLFTIEQAVTRIFQDRELQVVVEPAERPRILPSILEPMWSNTEAVEPVPQDRSTRPESYEDQIELGLETLAADENPGTAPAEASVVPDAKSQTEAVIIDEAAPRTAEADPSKASRAMAKPRKKNAKPNGEGTAVEAAPRPTQASTTEVAEISPVVTPREAAPPTLTKRQAAAAQLPRHERWKRRLHPATW
jgi:hypothetical protein